MAHVSENGRKGQIPTQYPSSPFTVPQCNFAQCAIIRTANSANSHGEFGEFARQIRHANSHGVPAPLRRGTPAAQRRRGAPQRQRIWHAACIGSWQVHTISRFACMARRIRGAKSHACQRRGAAAPPTANAAPQRRGGGCAEAPPTAIHRPLPTAPPTANGRASLRLAAGRNYSCGHIATLPRAMAWCAGNQCCCRHGGRRDGQWRRRGGGSTRRAPSATWLSRRLLYNLG